MTDAKAPCGAHQASDESVHGVVPAGEEEDHRELPRLAQRGDLEEPGEEVEGADGGGEEAVRGGGGKAEDAPPQGVPPVQVSAKEEAEDDDGRIGEQREETESDSSECFSRPSQSGRRGEGGEDEEETRRGEPEHKSRGGGERDKLGEGNKLDGAEICPSGARQAGDLGEEGGELPRDQLGVHQEGGQLYQHEARL